MAYFESKLKEQGFTEREVKTLLKVIIRITGMETETQQEEGTASQEEKSV